MENDQNTAAELKELKGQVAALFRALRVLMSFLLLGTAFLNVWADLRILSMESAAKDMNMIVCSDLPAVTRFIMGLHYVPLVLSILLALAGLAVLFFVKSPARGIILAAVAAVLLIVIWQVVTSAMTWPLIELMNGIDGEPN